MKKFLIGGAVLFFTICMMSQAMSVTLVLQPADGKDTELVEHSPNSNYGSWANLTTNWGNYPKGSEGLVEFDLTSITGVSVSSATLSLYHYSKLNLVSLYP